MVNPLPVTKGITSAVVTSIPASWDANWFRSFIINFLAMMDIRNTAKSTSTTNIVDGASVNTSVTQFTSTQAGTVPASGGGTTNFLRADGTWAAAGGGGSTSPGGTNTDIQFNNSGVFGGSANLTWNGTNLNVSGGGGVVAATFNATSDPTMKMNMERIRNSGWLIDNLNGYTFLWTGTAKPSMGVKSTDVNAVAPELVSRFQDHDVVNYNGLVAILIEEVKSLRNRVKDLETRG